MKQIYAAVIFIASLMTGCGEAGSSGASASGDGTTGVGGSMARFTIVGNKLYTLNGRTINAFDIEDPTMPMPEISQPVPFDVETLQAYKNYLYVGAQSGVYIYDQSLDQVAKFTHLRSCDPVVVQDDLAYVTLNSGNGCHLESGENSLQVLDVKDPLKPVLIKTKNMFSPSGLGIDGKDLFICDGAGGLKLFDVNVTQNYETNKTAVALTFNRASSRADIDCYDLIAHKGLLVVSNGDDVREFDYTHLPMVDLGIIK